jgi:hypothetical protein
MAVRVRIEIVFLGKKMQTVAIANAGYEAGDPELLIPYSLAIKRWKQGLRKAITTEYKTAGGPARFKILGRAKVKVKCIDRSTQEIVSNLLVSDTEDEALLNDKLIEKLGIILLKPGKGTWRFNDDPADKERASEPSQRW